MTIGQRLRQLREAKGVGLRELSRLAEVPASTITRIESGTTRSMSLEVARRLCRALGVSIDVLAQTWKEEERPLDSELQPAAALLVWDLQTRRQYVCSFGSTWLIIAHSSPKMEVGADMPWGLFPLPWSRDVFTAVRDGHGQGITAP